MRTPLLPNESIRLISHKDPLLLRERLASRTAFHSFLPRIPTEDGPVFEGTFKGDEFRLQMIKHSGSRLNPVVRGSIREGLGGTAIEARISLNKPFVASLALGASIYFLVDLSSLGQFVALAIFIVVLRFNQLRVIEVSTAFRREISLVAELHDTWGGFDGAAT